MGEREREESALDAYADPLSTPATFHVLDVF
jgi:hypothetical protein